EGDAAHVRQHAHVVGHRAAPVGLVGVDLAGAARGRRAGGERHPPGVAHAELAHAVGAGPVGVRRRAPHEGAELVGVALVGLPVAVVVHAVALLHRGDHGHAAHPHGARPVAGLHAGAGAVHVGDGAGVRDPVALGVAGARGAAVGHAPLAGRAGDGPAVA